MTLWKTTILSTWLEEDDLLVGGRQLELRLLQLLQSFWQFLFVFFEYGTLEKTRRHYKKFDWFTWTCYIKIINRYETVFDNVILKIGRWKLGKLFFKFFGLSITGKCTVASYLINNLLGVLASPAMKLRQLFLDREQLLLEKRNSFGGQMIRNGSGAGNGSSTSCQTRFEI